MAKKRRRSWPNTATAQGMLSHINGSAIKICTFTDLPTEAVAIAQKIAQLSLEAKRLIQEHVKSHGPK